MQRAQRVVKCKPSAGVKPRKFLTKIIINTNHRTARQDEKTMSSKIIKERAVVTLLTLNSQDSAHRSDAWDLYNKLPKTAWAAIASMLLNEKANREGYRGDFETQEGIIQGLLEQAHAPENKNTILPAVLPKPFKK